jgi:hypothetical protein
MHAYMHQNDDVQHKGLTSGNEIMGGILLCQMTCVYLKSYRIITMSQRRRKIPFYVKESIDNYGLDRLIRSLSIKCVKYSYHDSRIRTLK